MAEKEMFNVKDVKITTEKEVKPRPSVEELTTIESPGKPSPASLLESRPRRAKKSSEKLGSKEAKANKTNKAEPAEIRMPKKDSTLVITEKPQAALKIALSLGKPRKYSENNVPYYEIQRGNEKIIVASAVGHLFNLTYSKGQKGWPLFELEWMPSYEKKGSEFTKRYYDVLKKICRKAKEIIIATDFDTEGEVIGWNVLRFICKKNTAKRMKFSTLTSAELEKSFSSPLPELNWQNAYAGEARHFIDWLYGINLSRALMSAIKTTGSFKILSIGRVQGPALKIIVDREREIESFKPEPYWQVFALANGIQFKHPEDIFDKKELEKFKGIKEAIAETKKTEEKISPPAPFDLTTLQTEAYRHCRISPSDTLKIAQQLYLDGLISYPRTSSQKIPDAIEPRKILKLLERNFAEAVAEATRQKPVEGKKSDPAHPSIYPTGEFKQLSGRDEKIYGLVVKRFISAFSKDAVTANKRVTLKAGKKGDIKFTASGMAIIEKGWTKVYPAKMEEVSIPDIDGKVKIDEIKIDEKETQPPKRYTPASLISTLEKKNLGTKSTRASIVDTLFDRGYLDGKSIQATALGLKLIEALEKYSPIIIDENLTRQLENEMEKIQESSENLESKEKEVIDKAKRVISDISKEFKAKESEIGQVLTKGLAIFRENEQKANTLMLCPACKKGNLRIMYNRGSRRYFVACSAYPDCRQTYSLPPNSLIKKSENKFCEADSFQKLLAIRKGKRPWEFCFNPECPVEKKKREEWQAKKNAAKAESEQEQEQSGNQENTQTEE